MSYIKVDGYDAKGNKRSTRYMIFAEDCYTALESAIRSAKEAYTCDYVHTDDGYKPTGDSYREFEQIVSIQLCEEG